MLHGLHMAYDRVMATGLCMFLEATALPVCLLFSIKHYW